MAQMFSYIKNLDTLLRIWGILLHFASVLQFLI